MDFFKGSNSFIPQTIIHKIMLLAIDPIMTLEKRSGDLIILTLIKIYFFD